MSKQKPSIPQGTRDFAPDVMIRREWIFQKIRMVFRKYGFLPLETPSMEKLAVLTGKYGEEGDRLIFKILNSGEFLSEFQSPEELWDAKEKSTPALAAKICEKALRYDLTVPFARWVAMNHALLTYPFKRSQIQPVWRADRPQKGRYREFYQCDADVVGSDSLIYEAEFICIYDEALSNMGLTNFTILVNNRKILSGFAEIIEKPEKFVDICTAIDKFDKVGEEGVAQELGERGLTDSEISRLMEIVKFQGTNEEKITFLTEKFANSVEGKKGIEEMQAVFSILSHLHIRQAKVEFSLLLARGLGYYTGTIYEVKVEGVQIGSIGGGGRYDNLTGIFGLNGISGVGISFGADRIYDVLNELNLFPPSIHQGMNVLVANFGESTLATSLSLLQLLRDADISAEIYPKSGKITKQFEYADKKNIPYVLIIGETEQSQGVYQLKNLRTGYQKAVEKAEIVPYILEELNKS